MTFFQDGLPPNGYSRYGHTCTCIRNGRLICHAGSKEGNDVTKDTYIFDPGNNHFSQVEVHPFMEGRMWHAVAYVPETDQLYMYGGHKIDISPEVFREFWMMNIAGKKSAVN